MLSATVRFKKPVPAGCGSGLGAKDRLGTVTAQTSIWRLTQGSRGWLRHWDRNSEDRNWAEGVTGIRFARVTAG